MDNFIFGSLCCGGPMGTVAGIALTILAIKGWLIVRSRLASRTATKNCPDCGKPNRVDADFCQYCGVKL